MDTKSNVLLPGDELRKTLCLVAGGEDNIRHIKTVRAEPRASLATRVSSLVGNAPVYAWHTAKTGTITLTSNADRIVLPSDMSGAFRNLRFLETIEVGCLDASQTQDIRFLFDGCGSLRSITGLDSLDLASVERAANATNGCTALGKTRGMTLSRLESELSELVSDVDSLAEYAYEQGLMCDLEPYVEPLERRLGHLAGTMRSVGLEGFHPTVQAGLTRPERHDAGVLAASVASRAREDVPDENDALALVLTTASARGSLAAVRKDLENYVNHGDRDRRKARRACLKWRDRELGDWARSGHREVAR